jgi:hypothetical protein
MLGNYGVSKQLGISRVVVSSMELVLSIYENCKLNFETPIVNQLYLPLLVRDADGGCMSCCNGGLPSRACVTSI